MLKNYFFYLILCAVLIIGFIYGDILSGSIIETEATIVRGNITPSKFTNPGKTLIVETKPSAFSVSVVTRVGEIFEIECDRDFYYQHSVGDKILIEKTVGGFSGNIVDTKLK